MMNRHFHAWLRSACALICGASVLLLTACGGGNGAPNNPYAPPPPPVLTLQILPETATVYAGAPTTLTVSGGVPPYRAFSSDTNALPISQAVSGDTIVLSANNVIAGVIAAVTVQDSRGVVSGPAQVTIQPAPLFQGGITITANANPDCPQTDNAICSGGTGTAQVKVLGFTQLGVPGHPLRFDVIQGNFQIVSTNPAQPLVQTFTVVSDVQGNASVVLNVPANTPTQVGILRVTDTISGNQITGTFTIVQLTTNGQVLSVLPLGTTTITGPDNAHCSSGVVVNYYIFGGTPPYTVVTNFPQAIQLGGLPVTKSGGGFTATTTGICFQNGTFAVTDATGLTLANAPTITNNLGTGTPVPPQTPLIVTPGAIAKANCVPANTFQFIGTGGTAPYSAVVTSSTSSTSPTIAPQTGIAQGTAVVVSGLTSPSSTTITLFDNSSPRQSGFVTIDCSGTGAPPIVGALTVNPGTYSYRPTTCVNQISKFVVTGGVPPYTVFFATPRPGASIVPTTVAQSGQGFDVTSLTDGVATTNITVADSSAPALQRVVTIDCPPAPSQLPLTVTPGAYTYFPNVGQGCATPAPFAISGGSPPYTAFFATPGTPGTIAPQTNIPAGANVVVTLPTTQPVPSVTTVTIQDSNPTPNFKNVIIDCRLPSP